MSTTDKMDPESQSKGTDNEKKSTPTPARRKISQPERKKSLGLKRTDLPPPPPPPGASSDTTDGSPKKNIEAGAVTSESESASADVDHTQSRPLPPPPIPSSKPVAHKKSSENLFEGKSRTPPPLPASKPKGRTYSPKGSPDIPRKISANNKPSPQSSPRLSRSDGSTKSSVKVTVSPETKGSPPKLPAKPPKAKQLSQSLKVEGPSPEKESSDLTQSLPTQSKLALKKVGLQGKSQNSQDSDAEQAAGTNSSDSPPLQRSNKCDKTDSTHSGVSDLCIANSTHDVESSPPSLTESQPTTPLSKSTFYVSDDSQHQDLEGDKDTDFERRISASKFYVDPNEDTMALNQSTRTVKTSFSSSSSTGSTQKVTITKQTTVISGNKVQKSSSSVTSSSWKSNTGADADDPINKLMRSSDALKLLEQKTGAFGGKDSTPIPPARRHKPSMKLPKALSEDDKFKLPSMNSSSSHEVSSRSGSLKTTTVTTKSSVSAASTESQGAAAGPVNDWRAGLKKTPSPRPKPAVPPPSPPKPRPKVEMRPVRVQVQKQASVASFTTEDFDLFQTRKSRDMLGSGTTKPPAVKAYKASQDNRHSRRDGTFVLEVPDDKAAKRRSRSVGAPFQAMRIRTPNNKPQVPSKPPKPKLPGPGEVTPGPNTSPVNISTLINRLQQNQPPVKSPARTQQEPKSPAAKTVNIPIVISKSASQDEDVNANKDTQGTETPILETNDTQDVRSATLQGDGSENTNATSGNTDSNKNIILDPLDIDDPNMDQNVLSDSEETSLQKVSSWDDIYQEIEFSEGEKSPGPKSPTRQQQQRKDSTPEASALDKEEEEKLRLKRKFTKKLPRKMSRKYSQRPAVKTKTEAIYETIGCDEDEETTSLGFSDQDSFEEDSFEEDSFTDDSDIDFEEQMIAKLANKGQNTVTEDEVENLVEEIYAERSMSKLQKVARELLTTERAYVDKLNLVDQNFHFRIVMENRSDHMFPDDVIPQMFSNIKSIYQFHHDFLLPKLEERMEQWSEVQKIGDVMKTFAPFLKLYTEYVKNFDNAMTTINLWLEKSPKFASIMEELQQLPRCGKLSLQHHMLEPIQRVPRYEMLLKDYLKHLPEDSDDREDTEKALVLVTTAASHSNEAMRKIEKFRKLLDVNESLLGGVDLISPTRELVKEGKIIKISARNGDHLERFLFLFNDLFLLCQAIPIGIVHQYRIKAMLDIGGMQVLEGDNLETPNTFYVKSKKKALELHTSSMEEKIAWQVTLWNIIADFTKKQMSRQAGLTIAEAFLEEELGKRAPTWIKDQETSMCMQCGATFNAFRRRHHCRACGIVVCAKCSTHKAQLAYDDGKPNRVCDKCFNTLMQMEGSIYQAEVLTPQKKSKGVLLVKAADTAILNGYLNMTCDKKIWQKRYFAIHDNFVLYSFKAHQDVVAMTSMPLPGYFVGDVDKADAIDKDHVFKLFHPGQKKIYFFQAEDKGHMRRWLSVLQKVVLAELPSATSSPHSSVLSTQSSVPGS